MRKLTILIFTLIIIVPCFPTEKNPPIKKRIHKIENNLVQFDPQNLFKISPDNKQKKMTLPERMTHYHVPGVGIAVINNYKLEWAKGYGVIKTNGNTPVTPDTYFEAASTTKLLTSAMALYFIEQGQLHLDEAVNKKLKSWRIPDNAHTREHPVTLRHLLTHQSGLNRPPGGFGYEDERIPTLIQVLKGEAPATNKAAAIEFTPGTQSRYSNFGYLVIQLLLEDVTGKSFAQIAQETIFKPLNMKSATFVHPLETKLKARIALPHDAEGKAHERPLHPTALGQGGLLTTPSDLALFTVELMRAFNDHSHRLLSRETARKMFNAELKLDPAKFGGISAAGLGVFLLGEEQRLHFLFPGYNMPGASCMLIASPVTGKGAIIMTNGNKGEILALEILTAIMKEYHWPSIR